MKLNFDPKIVNSMTNDAMTIIDKVMYNKHHRNDMPRDVEDLERIYIKTIRDEFPPESRAILDWNQISKHFLGYLEEVDYDAFTKLNKFTMDKSINKKENDIDFIADTSFRGQMMFRLKVEKPHNAMEVINLYGDNIDSMSDEDRNKLDYYSILFDIISYCEENFNIRDELDFNMFYLDEPEVVQKKGYLYFNQFRKDIQDAYASRDSWFYHYTCVDCNQENYLRRGEVSYFNDKELMPPKRCKDCRKKRKKKLPKKKNRKKEEEISNESERSEEETGDKEGQELS